MNDTVDYRLLAQKITENFKNSARFSTFKHIDECVDDGIFKGDVYLSGLFEPSADGGFRMMTGVSPFSAKTAKSTEKLLMFKNERLQNAVDWHQNVPIRTGVLDVVTMLALGLAPEVGDRFLIIGSGRVARQTAAALKSVFGEKLDVHYTYMRATGEPDATFEAVYPGAMFCKKESVNPQDYTYIFCHTNSKKEVITLDNLKDTSRLKLLTYYIDNSIGFEVEPTWLENFIALYGEEHVIVEVPETAQLKKEFSMIRHDNSKIKSLCELLNSSKMPTTPVVLRSGGSALQNLALYDVMYPQD